MKTNLHKHFLGIFKILQNRFDYINNSLGHSLSKGEANEKEIRKLLTDFLPSNYGIGSGIIVDVEGNESKQVDIIIFDNSIPNYTLQRDSQIYLIDQVLLTIEIKTTYSSAALEEALKNVESIRKLKPSNLSWLEPNMAIKEGGHTEWAVNKYEPSLPACCIFFYSQPERKKAIDLDGFLGTLKKYIDNYNIEYQPDLVFSLEHSAFYRMPDIGRKMQGKYHVCLLNLEDKQNNQVTLPGFQDDYKAIFNFGEFQFSDNSDASFSEIKSTKGDVKIIAIEGDSLTMDPLKYKTGMIKGNLYLIDSFKGFMNFVYNIEGILRVKKSNKNFFIGEYFRKDFFMLTDYDDGLKFTGE